MGLTLELSRASNRNSEARDAKRKSESENQAQEVSEDNKNSIRNWTRGPACYILRKNWQRFFVLKIWRETKLESSWLSFLTIEMSRQCYIIVIISLLPPQLLGRLNRRAATETERWKMKDKEMSVSELTVVDNVGMDQTSVTVKELASLKVNHRLCSRTMGKESQGQDPVHHWSKDMVTSLLKRMLSKKTDF